MTDAERNDDEAWLLARERGEPVAPHPRAAEYERLQQQIAALPELAAPTGWQQRVLEQIDGPRRPTWWRRALAIGIPAAALAAVAVAVWLAVRPAKPQSGAPAVAMEVRPQGDVRRGHGTASLGDVLVVRGTARHGAQLWVYRDQQLVTRCPGARCDEQGGELHLEITLTVPGVYRAVLVHDAAATPRGGLADDLAALERAGVRAETAAPIEVR